MVFPITVIIPTYNEEINLPHALESIKCWADQIIIVDSYSTDKTLEVCKYYGIEIYKHQYDNMASQRMWALQLPTIKHEWVLNLDADEQLTPEIKAEIETILPSVPDDVAGFMIRRKHIFMGRWMKHGGDFIWLIRLVRRKKCRIIKTPLINEHTIINGTVGKLHSHFLHESKKSFTEWIQRVNKGAQKFVLTIYQQPGILSTPKIKKGEQIEGTIRTFLNYNLYSRMPLILRPFIRFFIFYFFRGGFLDGWQGFVYHMVNDFIYPFLIYAKYKEITNDKNAFKEALEAKWR